MRYRVSRVSLSATLSRTDILLIETEALSADVGKSRAMTDDYLEQLGHGESELVELGKRVSGATNRARAFASQDRTQEPVVAAQCDALMDAYRSAQVACKGRRSTLVLQQRLWT
jgi:hypothetical protein